MSQNSSIVIFGLGASNLSVIKALVAQGTPVIAWDDNETAREKAIALGAKVCNPLSLADGGEEWGGVQTLILAPGVPFTHNPHPVVTAAQNADIEIICDIELRYRQGWDCKTIGITGTNGKSTTTALIGHVLQSAGIQAAIGGNIGTPVFDLDIPGKDGVLVLELSSYQLDLCPTFRPDIAVLLNITPDHIDRHGTMENYVAAKARMFEGNGKAIITGEDEESQTIKKNSRALLPLPKGLEEQSNLKGAHNIQNMQVAFAACAELGVSEEKILAAFKTFPGLPHRQYSVRKIGHVEYINDSKASNVEAASKALSSYKNIYWIAGGQGKKGGLSGLEEYFPHVKKTYLIGASSEEFSGTLTPYSMEVALCKIMENAVKKAHAAAQASGEPSVLLLSPAAASFDQYKNFEERGDHFTTLVEGLKE